MRAMVLHRLGGDFELEERPLPQAGPGEALIEVYAVGTGLTSEHARKGALRGASVPRVQGHELSGRVAGRGGGAAGRGGGGGADPVVSSFYYTCGTCRWCASGRESLCERFGGYVGVGHDGAFADYVALPVTCLVAIPDGVGLRDAGIISDAVATPYHVMATRLRLQAGRRVAVIGAGGGLGVHATQMVKAFGGTAIAVERDPGKAAELRERGLGDEVVVPQGENWGEQMAAAAHGSLDAVVDTVASDETLKQGLAALGRGGTLVVLGHIPGARLEVDPERLFLQELAVIGTRYVSRAEIGLSLELVRVGSVKPVVGARLPLEQLNEALRMARENEVFGRIVIDVAARDSYPTLA
jgi:D-arabinose 1-dehydrogenase-like Zn-dependent alcohol dehydrogenase